MGWNTQALFVHTPTPPGDLGALVAELGILGDPQPTGETDFAGATAMAELTDVAAAVVDGWTVITGIPVLMAAAETLAERSADGPIVVMALGGAASVYSFCVYRDGASVRDFVEQEGAVIRDEGEPLDEEQDLDDYGYTEARVLAIVGRLTVELAALEAATFATFTGVPAFD